MSALRVMIKHCFVDYGEEREIFRCTETRTENYSGETTLQKSKWHFRLLTFNKGKTCNHLIIMAKN